jgi:hypothetical protein
MNLFRVCFLRIMQALVCLLLGALPLAAQSIDVRFPTPITENEIAGVIAARDIGDARLTDHFYTFNGAPGDLLLTIDSKNFNGDFDVFTAAELRPLLKVVAYADSTASVTKNIFLRKPESLILRVEGRTPNDDEASYRIRFSGAFAPAERSMVAGTQAPLDQPVTTRSTDTKTTRVTSAGARIEEPVTAIVVPPAPAPSPEPVVEESTAKVTRTPAPVTTRARRPAPRKTTPKPATTTESRTTTRTKTNSTVARTETTNPKVTTDEEPAGTAAPAPRTTPRKNPPRTARPAKPAKAAATAENGQLIVEVNDGTRVTYPMSDVARVTVENGVVVIVSKEGFEKRVPLSKVVRMSIGP